MSDKVKIVGLPLPQGDVLFVPTNLESAPGELSAPEAGRHVVAHSETGHHHTVDASSAALYMTDDELTAYLEVKTPVPVVHERSFDTHQPVMLTRGVWQVRRQREMRSGAWARAAD